MSKKHMENNTQYIDEERRAPNKDERDAINAALVDFGEMQILGEDAVLVGRQDEPYGWYLFDLGDCVGDGKGRFLILGDCLDVLPDYGRLLTLDEVHSFAFTESDGRFDAIQKWDVFNGITYAFWHRAEDAGLSFEDQYMKWNDETEEWNIYYPIRWKVCDGLHANSVVRIPANLATRKDADKAFIADLKNIRVNEPSAEPIVAALEGRKTPAHRKEKVVKMGQTVWVLNIDSNGEVPMPEVHMTLKSCVAAAIKDIKEHMEEGDEVDFAEAEKYLLNQFHWKWDAMETYYDITECPVCD